jgi:UDP-N-acetylglucosamine/UDP-N-acetylgalactosamine 4-epimerase
MTMQLPKHIERELLDHPARWLVTGAAGFIGSHLTQALVARDQEVVGLDNLSTGTLANLDDVRACVGEKAWRKFHLIQGDICDPATCRQAMVGVTRVLHQAALCSVPLSIEKPLACNASNVTGCLTVLEAAREAGIQSFVYASSSAVYGDDLALPITETMRGTPLSPYALSKTIDEQYADLYARCYGLQTVGLRYFNVYGPRQDPNGAYAAVIPRWFAALSHGVAPEIFGDGLATRDFCFVKDVARANILAAMQNGLSRVGHVANVGGGQAVSLLALLEILRETAVTARPELPGMPPRHMPPRAGDIRHSLADVTMANNLFGFSPTVSLREGLALSADWYLGTGAR